MPSEAEASRRWLNDILHHIFMAHGFVGAMSYDDFKNDQLRLYGVTRCLEIILEASRRLPGAMKARYPSIGWREMAAAGNIYRHEYEDVAARAVWHTLKHDLPLLRAVVEAELADLTT